MNHEVIAVVRYTVERLTRQQKLCCVRRGKVMLTNTLGTAHRGLVGDISMRTDPVLDAIKQALYKRQPQLSDQLIHYSDREPIGRPQYVSIRYTGRLA